LQKQISKDLNCVSCGENVIQADARNPTQSMLTRNDEIHLRHDNINEIQLLKSSPTRLCLGNHTITTPREREFFDLKTVKIKCHVKSAAEGWSWNVETKKRREHYSLSALTEQCDYVSMSIFEQISQ
jgi:hypothetical protein